MTNVEELLERSQLAPRLGTRGRNALLTLAAAGWCASAAGFFLDRSRFQVAYLVGFLFFLTIALGALFFVLLHHLTGAAWSASVRPIAGKITGTLPVAAVLFLPIAVSLPSLYKWVSEPDPVKQAFLNVPFFLIRAAVYFAAWSLLALRSSKKWSGGGMVLLTVTVCLAGFDWLMSLEPEWYSTIFGIYVYAGAALSGFAGLTLVLLALRRGGFWTDHEQFHDLGKWIFGLVVFWAYIAFSQYLLIWYANLPEETIWFRERLTGGWTAVSALLLAGHFFVPFFVLLSRAAKRNLAVLGATAGWVLLMHYVDLYWIVAPVFFKAGPRLGWMDAATFLAIGSTMALVFWRRGHA